MKIEISDLGIEMLEDYRKELIQYFKLMKRERYAKAVEQMNYDHLIKLLHLGYNERDFFQLVLNNKMNMGFFKIDDPNKP